MSIQINGIEFSPIPGVPYKYDYVKAVENIVSGKWNEYSAIRELILNDLFFIVYFILKIKPANNEFVVKVCQEVEQEQQDYTLDVWAREHFKSTIITVAETIQYALKYPENATGIFSYIRPVAKKFLFTIKETFQREKILYQCFPDIVWKDCEREAPVWSLDDGITLKTTSKRPEPTVSAWGLTEGMPTGLHFNRRVYDDIVTEDIAESVETMEKVKLKFDSSQNVGTEDGTHRVVGTFYHHNDPLIYIKDKDTIDGERKLYYLRLKPATVDGTKNGVPVMLSQKRLDDLKVTKTFNCQQLLNPTPEGSQRLNFSYLKYVVPMKVPQALFRFMVIDPAGSKANLDSWAIHVVGIEPLSDEAGAANLYLLDSYISPMTDSEAIEQIVRMYIRGGVILQIGVEKVALSTTEVHVANALRAAGRHVSIENGSLYICRPAGRKKENRIEAALAWPLNNGKIHIVTSIPYAFQERLRNEMKQFPYGAHDDGIDALSYIYDMIKDYRFPRFKRKQNYNIPAINIA